MPPLNEGDILYMPTTLPGISIEEAKRQLERQDAVLASFPEVKRVFGKIGRAETQTDPAPLSMVETVVQLIAHPRVAQGARSQRWYSGWAPAPLKRVLFTGLARAAPETWDELVSKLNASLQLPGGPTPGRCRSRPHRHADDRRAHAGRQ
jgi:Cu(I)/Ag(I) efflux system membrane protein CusA/SilA